MKAILTGKMFGFCGNDQAVSKDQSCHEWAPLAYFAPGSI